MKKSKRILTSFVLVMVVAIFLAACDGNINSDEIAVGNPAPDFELTDSDGNTVTLAEYKGQPVLLFFHMAGG